MPTLTKGPHINGVLDRLTRTANNTMNNEANKARAHKRKKATIVALKVYGLLNLFSLNEQIPLHSQ
jgi:hypothetical protein